MSDPAVFAPCPTCNGIGEIPEPVPVKGSEPPAWWKGGPDERLESEWKCASAVGPKCTPERPHAAVCGRPKGADQ